MTRLIDVEFAFAPFGTLRRQRKLLRLVDERGKIVLVRKLERGVVLGGPAVVPGGRGSTGPRGVLSGWQDGMGWSARCEGVQLGEGCGDLAGLGPSAGEAEP